MSWQIPIPSKGKVFSKTAANTPVVLGPFQITNYQPTLMERWLLISIYLGLKIRTSQKAEEERTITVNVELLYGGDVIWGHQLLIVQKTATQRTHNVINEQFPIPLEILRGKTLTLLITVESTLEPEVGQITIGPGEEGETGSPQGFLNYISQPLSGERVL